MEQHTHYKAVVALGEKLVRELELEPGHDTLAKWMAHYVAELIHKAQSIPDDGPGKAEAEKECAEAILKLWDHVGSLTNKVHPFRSFTPILEFLGRLSKANPFYFPTEELPISNKWVERAEEIDTCARSLIGMCLEQGILEAAEKESEWIELASDVDDKNPTKQIVSGLTQQATTITHEENDDGQFSICFRKDYEGMIERLKMAIYTIEREQLQSED